MKIAALYARVSSTKQQLNENIASQIAAIQEYAQLHDYQISPHHIYKDDGYSGARLDRPALDRLRDRGCAICGNNAKVLFTKAQSNFICLDQANVRIPRHLIGCGNADVVFTTDNRTTSNYQYQVKIR
jgi:hypothetical protein